MRGGPSSEYEISLKSGETVLNNLPDQYEPVDILITRDGVWHHRGEPVGFDSISRRVDVIFNALHGEYGEDGQVQKILDDLKLKYTGSGHFASALAMNKHLTKMIASRFGLKTPRFVIIEDNTDPEQAGRNIINSFSPPWVIKPIDKGSSVGIAVAKNFLELVELLEEAEMMGDRTLVEEYIFGKEATCGVVENLRGQTIYALPPVEIRKPASKMLFDYEAKYSGITEEICPGNFKDEEKRELEKSSQKIHQALGLADYSRSDFIITKNGIYFLETNSLPGLTQESLLPKSLKAVGVSNPYFIDHVLVNTLKR